MISPSSLAAALAALFSIQGVLMFWDEWGYHRTRGLGAWERWGHPVDSIIYAAALVLPGFAPPRPGSVQLYLLLAALSCLVITKDEWVHTKECAAGEHWVHALLFIVHPLVLTAAGLLWLEGEALFARRLLPFSIGAFALYQIVYWLPRRAPARARI
ncbi:MAG: hypothetical protein ACREQK_13470 [Candidatus Binatia bacterium]